VAARRRRAEDFAPAGGALLALLIAVVLFLQFSIDDVLKRDEAIYAYGGQQLAEGVAPYASVFDPKTPLATGFAALATIAGRAVGADSGAADVHAMRILFFAFAVGTVLAIYLLGLQLWASALAALAGAVTFMSFKGFALDAIGGPNAKTPGIFFAVLSMALLVGRRWFWGAFAGTLAFLVWQPLGIYMAIALVAAPLVSEPGLRRQAFLRALAGVAIPLAVTALAFAAAGALSKLFEAAFDFPLTGVIRAKQTLLDRLRLIHRVVDHGYSHTYWLLWGGLLVLFTLAVVRVVRSRSDLRAAVRDPLILVVMGTAIPLAAFSAKDFQGYPDVYPALPYAALGVGGAVAFLAARITRPAWRRAAAAACLVAVAALAVASWSWFGDESAPPNGGLAAQRASAAVVQRVLRPSEAFYALGDPAPLVVTRRRNPRRFVYLSSGVAIWDIRRTPGGFEGWKRRLLAARPGVVMISGWKSACQRAVGAWLRTRFTPARAGSWYLFVSRRALERARRRGVPLQVRKGGPGSGRRSCAGATPARAGPPPGSRPLPRPTA
jgi:hypothetical protein